MTAMTVARKRDEVNAEANTAQRTEVLSKQSSANIEHLNEKVENRCHFPSHMDRSTAIPQGKIIGMMVPMGLAQEQR